MSYSLALNSGIALLSETTEERAGLCGQENTGDDFELMRRHIAGCDAAFGKLFDHHHMRLYRYCARMVNDQTVAEDVMQEVWERVVLLRERRIVVRQPSALLFTMARRLCLNQIRGAKRFTRLEEEAESGTARDDLEEMAVEALTHLPLLYREVLTLNIYSGYGLEEMAPMLGVSPAAVWKRASRARTMLREEVERMMANERGAENRRGQ